MRCALHPPRPGRALPRLGVLEHLGPALELADDRGDPLEPALLLGELGAVPDLERGELAPERLALELELGHLVAERLELGEQALQALAERRRREDDGSGSGARHGRGRRSLPDFAPLPGIRLPAIPRDEVSHRRHAWAALAQRSSDVRPLAFLRSSPSEGPSGRGRRRLARGAAAAAAVRDRGAPVRTGGGPGRDIGPRRGAPDGPADPQAARGPTLRPGPRSALLRRRSPRAEHRTAPAAAPPEACRRGSERTGTGPALGGPRRAAHRRRTLAGRPRRSARSDPGPAQSRREAEAAGHDRRRRRRGRAAHRRRRRDDDRVDRGRVARHDRRPRGDRMPLTRHAGRSDDLDHSTAAAPDGPPCPDGRPAAR